MTQKNWGKWHKKRVVIKIMLRYKSEYLTTDSTDGHG
jgi:hypothetical protein